MGKRVSASIVDTHHDLTSPPARSIRKRKRSGLNAAAVGKALRLNNSSNYWHENDDEDSSSNDAPLQQIAGGRNQSTKQANNSSILLNTSLCTVLDASLNESPKPVYTLLPSVVNGTILHDLKQKTWRLGRPIGKGNFGEIFLASNNITVPVTNENAKFVVKIEPHSNGPLFVEIHCLMNTAKKNSDDGNKPQEATALSQNPPSGIPDYIASGSHYFGDARYRFLVLQRFDRDLHSLIKNCRVNQKSVLTLAIQIVNVLENLHDKGYCHNDVKAQNLMISKCKYYKKEKRVTNNLSNKGKSEATTIKGKYADHDDEKQQTTDSGNSSEQDGANDDDDNEDDDDTDFVIKSKARKYQKYKHFDNDEDDEDFDDGATSQSNNSNSMDIYKTPVHNSRKRRQRAAAVEFSGSNPVRSCRRQQRNSTYEEMVKSHYLRPTKRVSYSEFFNEEASIKGDIIDMHLMSSDDESEEFLPQSARRTASKNKSSITSTSVRRLTRRQEKLASQQQHHSTPAIFSNVVATRVVAVEEERIFLIDFGLASKFMDNGAHRPFVMDQRRAHDGTLEFTSRDAHMGAHSRRSDLECLGYNLIFWSQGYLPWKDAAVQHQQEKVHRAKEYLMTDVREMLKQIYGKQVPKFLGEFLHQVGQLAYHERPDYERYRRLFESEYRQLGYVLEDMHLDGHEIMRTCVRFKEEIENKKDIFEMNKMNVLSIMKNLTTVGTPFHERTLSNRVSPKNLRSKSDKKSKKKKFSWAEILSQDPDQIARERAEKEFDREEESSDMQQPTVRRYEGKPTYAILEVQQRMRMNGRMIENEDDDEQKEDKEKEAEDDNLQEEEEEEEDLEDAHDEDDEEDPDSEEADSHEEDEDEESETDASEVSEQTPHTKCRTRRTTKCVTTTRKSSKTITTRATTTGRKRVSATSNKCAHDDSSMKTRTRSCTTIANKVNAAAVNNSKRGSATRSNTRKVVAGNVINVASAAGEEHIAARYYQNLDNGQCAGGRPAERRTRRCLIKTDAEEVTTDGDESNSNFSPDIRGLFNVWKKINNESIYFKGRAAASATAKHFKK